ncbi:ComEC/Rec2 family competence protein [Antrihabitans spumae]|uniref:ComEC/Rec2 family competence protein n=1 Tax=Antrihabitans spumae TaxID=3373370 RepID=A0ABW7JZ00_9NOCA
MVSVTILDVGHGNCSVVEDDGRPTIIDGGTGPTLLEYLREEDFQFIDTILISHADCDHIRGLRLALRALPDLIVHTVLVNPSQQKGTHTWGSLVEHLEQRRERHQTVLGPLLADRLDQVIVGSRTSIEILSPYYSEVLVPNNVNNTSGVVRITVDGIGEVLLPADIDDECLTRLLQRNRPLKSAVVVFPHHGGKAGPNTAEFARKLTAAVDPKVTVISLGRNSFGNPQPEVVAGVRGSSADTHICCTQLSRRCAVALEHAPVHLSQKVSAGRRRGESCGGTVTFLHAGPGIWTVDPPLEAHSRFVDGVPRPLCRSTDVSAEESG